MTTHTALITALAQAWTTHLPVNASGFQVADEAEAYAVHDGLVARLGWSQPASRSSGSRAAARATRC